MKKKLPYILTCIIMFSYPSMNFAQSPVLGKTRDFAIFTASGSVTNTGTATGTEVWGDVGTYAGAFSAFPPGILHGAIHVADGISATAAADVAVLYADLFGRTCVTVLTGTLGGGTTLGPGVYCKGDATTLNGELILDGGGNPDAIFIFKIDGTFATGAAALISVTNATSMCNVYWQVNGAFTLSAGDIFRGTIVANGDIHLLEGSTLHGRALSTAGAIDMHNNPVIDVTPCNNAIPVTFSLFNAKRTNTNSVLLKWQTASEINNRGFALERNSGNNSWVLAGFIPTRAPGGNSSTLLTYTYNDPNGNKGITQYRIRQVDIDNKSKYSQVIAIRGDAQKGSPIVYPNPGVNGRVNVVFEDQEGIRDIYLSDAGGRIVKKWTGISGTTLTIENLNRGIFALKVIMRKTGVQSIHKIIVAY